MSIALDLPTQVGLDPDDPVSEGEIGRVGVSIASAADLEALFDGITLDSGRMVGATANSISPMFIGLFLALARRRGVDPSGFVVSLQNGVLKEYVARGTQIFTVDAGMKLSMDAI